MRRLSWESILVYTVFVSLTLVSSAQAEKFVVWHTENDPKTLAALDLIKAKFERSQPGTQVEMIFAGWDDLYQRLVVAIRSGDCPDLTQIEPFMAAYLHRTGQLTPLDDVLERSALEDIYPPLRDLQLFDQKRYGLPTAWGISYYSVRQDLAPNLPIPAIRTTFSDYLEFLDRSKAANKQISPLLLPSNNLHVTLLFSELLAANGGSLFDAKGVPNFTDHRVLEVLEYWKQLHVRLPSELRNSTYAENFGHYAQGRALSLPGFFGRGTTLIERQAPEHLRSPRIFAPFPHPIGPSGTAAYATLDAEPWVILAKSRHPQLAREFLRFFYQKDNYLAYCKSVPLHLFPVFKYLAESKDYQTDPHVVLWRPYYDYAFEMMKSERVRPIFMSQSEDRLNPALFKLEGSQVILNMVRDVTVNGKTPRDAAEIAMVRAKSITSN